MEERIEEMKSDVRRASELIESLLNDLEEELGRRRSENDERNNERFF